jgi:hypothetical protein
VKTHWTFKIAAFVASVVSLSWLFAGWRAINETGDAVSWALLIGSTALTLLLIGLQGYWIYFDEKAKGGLRRRIELFEMIHQRIHCRAVTPVVAKGESSEEMK